MNFSESYKILENLVNHLPHVTCKIRLLDDLNSTISFVKMIQSTGIKFFTIHLRKKDENAKVMANWKILKEIKKVTTIPVFANGDILSPQDITKITILTSKFISY